jgi:hypothetical protein
MLRRALGIVSVMGRRYGLEAPCKIYAVDPPPLPGEHHDGHGHFHVGEETVKKR